MDRSVVDKKEFQEARTKPPKVRHGGSGDSAAFLCVLCNWLLSVPYQSYCGDRFCYNCLKLLAQNMKRSDRETIKCPGCGEEIVLDQVSPEDIDLKMPQQATGTGTTKLVSGRTAD